VTAGAVPGLSPLESAVMGLLWGVPGGLPAREVSGRLSGPAEASTTALGALRTLHGKGLVSRERRGRSWRYRASGSREEHLAGLVRAALGTAPDPRAVLRLALPRGTRPDPRAAAGQWQEMAPEEAADPSLTGLQSSAGINPALAHSARVWDYWLGGKDNYPADRQAGDQILSIVPELEGSVRQSRYFLARAVRYLAGSQGVTQFLDIGAGLPAVDSTHEIAQRVDPRSRVVYADSDPLVTAYARALLTSGPEGACGHIRADLRDPDDIVAGAARTLDFTRPVAILMLGVLNFVTDTGEATAIVRRLAGIVPAGSYLVICHPTAEVRAEAMTRAVRLWNEQGSAPVTLRTPVELAGFFDGLDLAGPGVVSCPRWQPDITGLAEMPDVPHFCGVARKPGEAASA
jgi:predicted transcriptional regulator/O-methyltransferase involved in polyketide biosynthesis